MTYVDRTLCITAELRDLMQQLWACSPDGAGMFLRPYGIPAADETPETIIGYISSGKVSDAYDAVWPVKMYEAGSLVSTSTGNAAAVVAMAASNDVVVSEQQVQSVFDACDISNQSAHVVMDRLGFVLL